MIFILIVVICIIPISIFLQLTFYSFLFSIAIFLISLFSKDVSLSWEYVDISREVIQRNTEKEGNNFPVEFSQEELSKRFQINKFTDFTFLTVLDHVEKILTHEANISPITERGIGKYCFGSLFDDKGVRHKLISLVINLKYFLSSVSYAM